MSDFHRTNASDPDSFIRGAARLLWAGITVSFPTKISDVISLTTFDAQTGWNDLGATKTGIQISVNNTETVFDVDQVQSELFSLPDSWECSVGTALAEMTFDRLSLAWEGSAVTVDTGVTPNEREFNFGTPLFYTQRRLAVLFQKPDGKVRGFFFRKAQRTPQASSIAFNKTGEQQTLPVLFKCFPDLSISDIYSRFFTARDQI